MASAKGKGPEAGEGAQAGAQMGSKEVDPTERNQAFATNIYMSSTCPRPSLGLSFSKNCLTKWLCPKTAHIKHSRVMVGGSR